MTTDRRSSSPSSPSWWPAHRRHAAGRALVSAALLFGATHAWAQGTGAVQAATAPAVVAQASKAQPTSTSPATTSSTPVQSNATQGGAAQAGTSKVPALPQHPPARAAYQKARVTCMKLAGNQRDVCQAAARLELTQAEAAAHAEKNDNAEASAAGRLAVAQAEYELALEMCQDQREPEQRACVSNATRALAQAKEREGGLEAPEARPQR